MAHPCTYCGSECYCHDDLADEFAIEPPSDCEGCGCNRISDVDDDEDDFEPCSRCDGHPACADFGCAFEHGLGHLVERNESNCHEL